MTNILFVCTGNTCRSPMAEHLLREKMGQTVQVRSAGVAAFPGQPASEEVLHIFKQKGLSIDHQAQAVTEELLKWADLVLTMTGRHHDVLKERYPEFMSIIHTYKGYVSSEESAETDISDPIGSSLEMYEQTYRELEELANQLRLQMNQLNQK